MVPSTSSWTCECFCFSSQLHTNFTTPFCTPCCIWSSSHSLSFLRSLLKVAAVWYTCHTHSRLCLLVPPKLWHPYLATMVSPNKSRRIFGCFSKSLEPAPTPIFRMVKLGGRPCWMNNRFCSSEGSFRGGMQ